MAKVKDLLIEMEELVWEAFNRGFDLKETIAYVKSQMIIVDEVAVEEMYQDLKDEF